ncbi:MAG TPA: carboxypeptidase-like regulatory domain-containing protein, partial [Candidatus Thermoplasmatota archaeon]|nr:carboxypeptidase-like regulatory domain-containing protein [Candidatus Thermoplasmatota archaeon]
MLRPLLAFATLSVAAFLLAPTVTSVGKGVEDLHIEREMPWSLWKWYRIPPPENIVPPDCDYQRHAVESEVTKWPATIRKNETFVLLGHVVRKDSRAGVPGIPVDLFLNATKEEPGEFLGSTSTDGGGRFRLETKVPHDLEATHYHLVAHSHQKQVDCQIWRESWSDPELDVTARTRIVLDLPEKVVIGRNLTVAGRVIDEAGGPVRNANVSLTVEGKPLQVVTDGMGAFRHEMRVERTGDVDVKAAFAATKYYGGSEAADSVAVVPEDVVLRSADGHEAFTLTRSRETTLLGEVLLAPEVKRGEVTVDFGGLKLATCAGCPPTGTMRVAPDAGGNFTLTLYAAPDQPPGAHRIAVSGGGLKQTHAFNT